MPRPTVVELPHALGRDEARRRLREKIVDLPRHVPGGAANVTTNWLDEDRMALTVTTLGQTISGTIEVEDQLLRVSLALPMMLSLMAGALTSTIRREGSAMLLEDKRDA